MGPRRRIAAHTAAGLLCGAILGIGYMEAGIVGVVAAPLAIALLVVRRNLVVMAATVIAVGSSWIVASVPAMTNTDPAVSYPLGAGPVFIGVALAGVGLVLWTVAARQRREGDAG